MVGRVFDENKIVYSLDRNEVEARDELANRGSEPLQARAEGVYDSRTGVIHIFGEKTDGPLQFDSNHTTYHEAGHAVDHHLGDESRSPEFRAALAQDLADANASGKISKNEKRFLDDPQEAYAEAFARTIDPKSANQPGKLPNTVAYMKRNRRVQDLLRDRRDARQRR